MREDMLMREFFLNERGGSLSECGHVTFCMSTFNRFSDLSTITL